MFRAIRTENQTETDRNQETNTAMRGGLVEVIKGLNRYLVKI